jgi:hypothetical protein
VVAAHFGRHPDAEIYASLPGLGTITRASGTKRIVLARYARNRRLGDTLQQWAFCSLRGSPGAHAYNQQLRGRNIGHQAALRQLANRLVGILHRCLKTHTPYDEHTAWAHHHSGRLTPKNLGCLPRWARPGHPR